MRELPAVNDPRLLTRSDANEDSAVVAFPGGKALVQTVDFFTPIVNDPYRFGQIAAANALSDVYAMGGEPLSAMNVVCFPMKEVGAEVLTKILQGGRDKVDEAGAVAAGGHSVEGPEVVYGLAVSGVVDAKGFASNDGLVAGNVLILTKPIGTGVLGTAIKGKMDPDGTMEDILYQWAGQLNQAGARVIRELGLTGATDVTGFGLGGHLLEMAHASGMCVEIELEAVPFLKEAVELAGMGFMPAGSFANKKFCSSVVEVAPGADPIRSDLVFDAQTSGGLVLALPEAEVERARDMLLEGGCLAECIGRVLPKTEDRPFLHII